MDHVVLKYLLLKNTHYKWTHALHICAVQELTAVQGLTPILIMGGLNSFFFFFLASLKNGKIWLHWDPVPRWDQLVMDKE